MIWINESRKILALKTVRKRIYEQLETVQGMTGLCTGDDNSLKVQTGDYRLYKGDTKTQGVTEEDRWWCLYGQVF